MWISKLHLKNIRGFSDSGIIDFSNKINIFVGPNNSGKSTILNSILLFQNNTFSSSDITLEKTSGNISVYFEDLNTYFPQINHELFKNGTLQNALHLELKSNGENRKFFFNNHNPNSKAGASDIPSVEPQNLIYPFLSKRKVIGYSETINNQTSNSVTGNFQNLYSKIDRLSNPYFQPGFEEYQEACINILGFPVSSIASDGGKRAALIVKNLSHIPLTSMGEGVANLLGLIVDLCMAENKVFLVEEPENDIHPKALKSLLELIERKSETNQFFISTHSNIVTKYLGSKKEAKVFQVNMSFAENKLLPISSVKEIANTKIERQQVLEDLGYEFYDYDLWKAWLFLEESSAEVIIRDFLIPMFVPSLGKKLRTFSSRTMSEIEVKFKDFNNLFVFLHLEPIYKNKAWVVLDNGKFEKEVIDKMKEYYLKHGWNESNFIQFTQHNFEKYYPITFQQRVDEVLSIVEKNEKREQKKQLLEELKIWITENKEKAKKELAISANEIIVLLKTIDKNTK